MHGWTVKLSLLALFRHQPDSLEQFCIIPNEQLNLISFGRFLREIDTYLDMFFKSNHVSGCVELRCVHGRVFVPTRRRSSANLIELLKTLQLPSSEISFLQTGLVSGAALNDNTGRFPHRPLNTGRSCCVSDAGCLTRIECIEY